MGNDDRLKKEKDVPIKFFNDDQDCKDILVKPILEYI
jgi:hypothetical protein